MADSIRSPFDAVIQGNSLASHPNAAADPSAVPVFGTETLPHYSITGTEKLLQVIFVIDCSISMDGPNIQSVNAALVELRSALIDFKNDNNVDLKVSVMSFTSNAAWEITPTPVDEIFAPQDLQTRPGLTSYGIAFKELNKVLRKDRFMAHKGKVAPPAIIFLTDGKPNDYYQDNLDELRQNAWFLSATRSAILIGEAYNNPDARNAVKDFVSDPNQNIYDVASSSDIVSSMVIATLGTIGGNPPAPPVPSPVPPVPPVPNPVPPVPPVPNPVPPVPPAPNPVPPVPPVPNPVPPVPPVPNPVPPVPPVPNPVPPVPPVPSPVPPAPGPGPEGNQAIPDWLHKLAINNCFPNDTNQS